MAVCAGTPGFLAPFSPAAQYSVEGHARVSEGHSVEGHPVTQVTEKVKQEGPCSLLYTLSEGRLATENPNLAGPARSEPRGQEGPRGRSRRRWHHRGSMGKSEGQGETKCIRGILGSHQITGLHVLFKKSRLQKSA